LQAVKKHIIDLHTKNYQALFGLTTLDFVFMFIPIEPAFLLVMQKEPDIWSYAYEKKVILISPTNLIAALQMVSSLWQQDNQSRNALEIAQKAGAMYDKFVGFVEDLNTVGKSIDKTQDAYNEAMKKLHQGRGNLVRAAETLRDLGAKTSKGLPDKLLGMTEE
jgi:DNA recombination protein RmuC